MINVGQLYVLYNKEEALDVITRFEICRAHGMVEHADIKNISGVDDDIRRTKFNIVNGLMPRDRGYFPTDINVDIGNAIANYDYLMMNSKIKDFWPALIIFANVGNDDSMIVEVLEANREEERSLIGALEAICIHRT